MWADMARMSYWWLLVLPCLASCDSTKFFAGNSGLLSCIMETLEFLTTDGVWFGNGAEEEQRFFPLHLLSDHHHAGTREKNASAGKRRHDDCRLKKYTHIYKTRIYHIYYTGTFRITK